MTVHITYVNTYVYEEDYLVYGIDWRSGACYMRYLDENDIYIESRSF